MKRLVDRKNIPASLAVMAILVAVLLYLLPAESTLGNAIKVVFLHGAVARTGLIVFAVAGLVGIVFLLRKSQVIAEWSLAAQKTAVTVWIMYELTGLASSYLAWGIAAPFDEPQVVAGIKVLGTCIVFLMLTLWINDHRFTAVVNIVMGVMAWVVMKSAVNVRHPTDPIGSSNSVAFKLIYNLILVMVMVMTIQVGRWLYKEEQQ